MKSNKEILDHKFYCDDLDCEVTIRGYFRELLSKLWEEEEGFSGKRPFGNSGWTHDLERECIKLCVVSGRLDSDGYVADIDQTEFNRLIFSLIDSALED